jgi:hypothetical protein
MRGRHISLTTKSAAGEEKWRNPRQNHDSDPEQEQGDNSDQPTAGTISIRKGSHAITSRGTRSNLPAPRYDHQFAQYLVSDSEAEVTCGRCGVRLNRYGSWPGWRQKVHLEEMKHLNERSRAQCEWRGRMTGISHFTELRVTPHPQPS